MITPMGYISHTWHIKGDICFTWNEDFLVLIMLGILADKCLSLGHAPLGGEYQQMNATQKQWHEQGDQHIAAIYEINWDM